MTVDGREKFIGSYATMAEALEVRNAKYAEFGIPVTETMTKRLRGIASTPERVTIKWREELHAGRYFLRLI